MIATTLETHEINTDSSPRHSIIWMHGLGADGYDFAPIVPELALPASLSIRFIFPHAPFRSITLNQGMQMRAWYDVSGFDRDTHEDRESIEQSAAQVGELIQKENERGVPSSHIILAGFSQGGAIALYTGLGYPEKLAGIMALSTYLPLRNNLIQHLTPANKWTSIFMAHGQNDPVIDIEFSKKSRDALKVANLPIQWEEYPMAHSVSKTEIDDISTWIQQVFR
ncbi:MAG: alpha/beta hydrolase [Proteobacteria bacterium]|nr:alpha/beta hydrolase [Pseudomonadota bacterium]MDE3207916.1 dienelactone hydrolase family protein [Pseudomonadota bacterium]